jgi:hypothetical protein
MPRAYAYKICGRLYGLFVIAFRTASPKAVPKRYFANGFMHEVPRVAGNGFC